MRYYLKNNKNLSSRIISLFSLFLFIILIGCEKDPSEIGRNLIPSDDELLIYKDSTLTFDVFVEIIDPYYSEGYTKVHVGTIDHPILGIIEAGFGSQIYPSDAQHKFGTRPECDSIIVYFDIENYFGDYSEAPDIDVYLMNVNLNEYEDTIYTDHDRDLYGAASLYSEQTDYYEDSLVTIKLSNYIGNRLLTASSEQMDSIPWFTNEILKGLYFKTNEINRYGLISSFTILDQDSSYVRLYYKNDTMTMDTSYQYDYYFNIKNYSEFKYSYEGYPINDYLTNDTLVEDTLLCLQGLDGTMLKMKFTNLDEWAELNSPVSLNKAELVFEQFKYENYFFFEPPAQINVWWIDDDGYSRNYTSSSYDPYYRESGLYNKDKTNYTVNITQLLQDMIQEDTQTDEIYIMINTYKSFPNSVVLKGGNSVKLNVYYSKL